MEENKKSSSRSKRSFAILASLSVMIMVVAVIMIYLYTRQVKPDVVSVNAQSTSASENVGYINEDSPQVLENDAAKLQLRTFKDSQIFIVGAGVFMIIIVVSFGVVKFVEHKEDE